MAGAMLMLASELFINIGLYVCVYIRGAKPLHINHTF